MPNKGPSGDPIAFVLRRDIKANAKDDSSKVLIQCSVDRVEGATIFYRPDSVLSVEGDQALKNDSSILEPRTISQRSFDTMLANGYITHVRR